MWLKYPLLCILFFLTTLLQISFLPRLGIWLETVNLIFITFFVLVFFETTATYYSFFSFHRWFFGFFLVLSSGLMLDIISPYAFGYSSLALLLVYIGIKIASYFLKESQDTYLFIYFVLIFLISIIFYSLLLHVFTGGQATGIYADKNTFNYVVYNTLCAALAFYLYKILHGEYKKGKQLKLFR